MRIVKSVPANLLASVRDGTKVGSIPEEESSGPYTLLGNDAPPDVARQEAQLGPRIARWVKKRLPFLDWMPKYNLQEDLLSDIIGGVTIGMVCLAQTLAHAAIATTRPIQGPYCAFVPAFAYAFIGTSPHASVSSGAIAAIVIADQLKFWPDIDDRTQLASLLALVSGATLILCGICKLSFLVRFLSLETISGFVTGGSILIMAQQLKNLLGFKSDADCAQLNWPADCEPFPHTDRFVDLVMALVKFLPTADPGSLILGIVLMLILEMFNRLRVYSKKALGEGKTWAFPLKRVAEMKEIIAVMVAVSVGFFTADDEGKPVLVTVGHLESGLPQFRAPWDNPAAEGLWKNEVPRLAAGSSEWIHHSRLLQQFMIGGALIAFTTFLTTYATAKKMAMKKGYELDPAQEMIGLGSAGVAGSFFGAFPPSGSLSRTGLADECGVKTQLGGVFCAGIVGVGLMYLTPALLYLPKASLAAIILTSTKSLVDFVTPRGLVEYWRPAEKGGLKRDLVVWCLAFLFTIFLGVLQGILIAVLFSVLVIVADASEPQAVTLCKVENVPGRKWRNVKDWGSQGIVYPGILIFEFRGPLCFASADHFEQQIEKARIRQQESTQKKVSFVIISFSSVHRLDSTALAALKELIAQWKKDGIECIISGAKHQVRKLIEEELNKKHKLVDMTDFMISIGDAVDIAEARMRAAPADDKSVECPS